MQFCSVLVLHTGSSLILPCNQQQCAAVCSQFVRGNFYSFQFALSLNFGHFFFSNLFFFCERALSFRLLKMNFFFFFSEIKLLALPSGGNAQTTAISKANCCIWECWCAADGNGNFVSALQLRSAATYYYCLAFLFLFSFSYRFFAPIVGELGGSSKRADQSKQWNWIIYSSS